MQRITEHPPYTLYLDSSTRSGDAFYGRIGAAVFDRAIRKALDGALNNDDTYEWLLAYTADGALAAFSSFHTAHLDKGVIWLDNAYVYPEHRKQGLHHAMFDLRLTLAKQVGATVVKGLATLASRDAFEANGFTVISERGQYRTYQKELE